MKTVKLPLLLTLPVFLVSCGGQTESASSERESLIPSESSSATSVESSAIPKESSAPASSETVEVNMVSKEVNLETVTHFDKAVVDGEIPEKGYYSDYWFQADSREVNYELATMSALVGGASYASPTDLNGRKVSNLLSEMGFTDIELNQYYSEGIMLTDSLGAAIGRKTIADKDGKPYTLLAIFPRNAGYRREWSGNFNIGESGLHEGFRLCKDELARFLKHYIDENDIAGDIKIWGASYSRGAAASNVFGAFLAEDSGYFGEGFNLSPEDIYFYSIGTPNVTPASISKKELLSVSGPRGEGYFDTEAPSYEYKGKDEEVESDSSRFDCIHNFVAIGDFVTKLPPKEWGFTRFGKTEEILYGGEGMLEYLKEYSKDAAALFEGGRNCLTETPNKTFDILTFSEVDSEHKQSANAVIDERIGALASICGNRENMVKEGYGDVLRAAGAVFGGDPYGFLDGIKSDIGPIAKAGVFNLATHLFKRTGFSESKAFAYLLSYLFNRNKVPFEEYTDKLFLSDLLDYLFNDYVDPEQSKLRYFVLSLLIPSPYGRLYAGILNYALTYGVKVKTFDDLLLLLSSYVNANKEYDSIKSLIDNLIGLIPEKYASYLSAFIGLTGKEYSDEDYPVLEEKNKAIIYDVFDTCENGSFDKEGKPFYSADKARYMLLTIASGFGLSGASNLSGLLLDGSHDTEETTVSHEPVALSLIVDDMLKLILPKNEAGEPMTVEGAANQSLMDVLRNGQTEENASDIETIAKDPAKLREVLFAVLLYPQGEFSLSQDVEKALTMVDKMKFLVPAHYNELYLSFLRDKVDQQRN